MKPPHTPRPSQALPKRVPGGARPVSSRSGPAQDGTAALSAEPAAPGSGDRAADAAGKGTSLPRLTQISSLGSRGNAGRGAGASSSAADASMGGSAGDTPGDNFARRGDTGRSGAPDVVPPAPADRHQGDKARREGFRGALAVVGIVGLLAAGSVALTLVLAHGHHDKRSRGSVTVGSGDRGTGDVNGLGDVPASATGTDEKSDGSGKHAAASPKSSAPGKGAEASGKHATTAADTTGTGTTAPAATPGVNVFSHASHRCVDVVGGKAVQGARLMIWDCSESAAQHWTFTGGAMRALGMCVQLAGGSTADGADLELASCNGSPAQRFVLNPRHDLVSTLANKCTDVRDSGTANGTRLQLWSCSGTPNQKWSTS
ncbi:ricin-type beta-trefoil lectin domain protein [Streptomyces sp. NPDC088560]|uniref:ricin-type beta-trefoil lectin domain protein n=1 Tax=Streptomyces sp. NPDC088560 TaxID=3365868 RepID=UPI003807F368